MSESKVDL